MTNKITEMLNIEYPVFMGSMANITHGKFVAAVSEAGGLGTITGGSRTAEQIREDIVECRKHTNKPFAVNAVMQPKEIIPSVIDMLIEEKVKIVVTSAGNPGPWIPVMHEAGIIVMCVVATSRQATKAEAAGADVIIAEGSESGGHIGNPNTLPFVAAVTSAVSIPVVAAGGIADGRGMAAALMLGADAVQCGTAFMVTEECPISETFKQKILEAQVEDTIITGHTANDVVRSLRSPLSSAMYDWELKGGDPAKIIEMGTGSLRRAVNDGDWEKGSFQVGQTVGLLTKRTTCRELIENMVQEAKDVVRDKAKDISCW